MTLPSTWLMAIPLGVAVVLPIQADAVRDLPGFRTHSLPPADDDSSGPVPLPFYVNFFGKIRAEVFVNNNGNLTFVEPSDDAIPYDLASTGREIVAAFLTDVDTRDPESGRVTYGQDTVDGRLAFGVNYINVGYYAESADRLNSFQIVLIDRSDTGEGNFDIELNYDAIRWDAGFPFGGTGSVPAAAGYSNGTGEPGSFFQLAGSLLPGSFLDDGPTPLALGAWNVDGIPGRYVLPVRASMLPPPPPRQPPGDTILPLRANPQPGRSR